MMLRRVMIVEAPSTAKTGSLKSLPNIFTEREDYAKISAAASKEDNEIKLVTIEGEGNWRDLDDWEAVRKQRALRNVSLRSLYILKCTKYES